jgi:L,D-transpeptidase ErfK/SrfK
MYMRLFFPLFIVFLLHSSSFAAEVYLFSKDNTVIGMTKTYTIRGDESLIEIARKIGIGYNEITDANPKLDPFVPGDGVAATLPTAWVLPDMKSYDGIVINLSEMRLYYFPRKRKPHEVMTFPIGIGSEGTQTPEGSFTIVEKMVNPKWIVPESIRQERPELPQVMPSGPDNPLGTHALRLSATSILIHGTNRPYAVGRKASHGCIRLYPEDIPKLFSVVSKKTRVTILRQPVKVGILNKRIYLEVHKDMDLEINFFDETIGLLRKKNLYENIDKEKMLVALKEKRGIPVDISR